VRRGSGGRLWATPSETVAEVAGPSDAGEKAGSRRGVAEVAGSGPLRATRWRRRPTLGDGGGGGG
jgi:hypothetical protein